MTSARQEEVTGERLVARFANRRFLPHVLVASASLFASGAWLAYDLRNCAAGRALIPVFLFSALFLGLALVVFTKIARKFTVVVDRDHLECPLDGFVVPWDEVESMTLLRGRKPMLRLGVRDPNALLQRQPPDVVPSRRRPRHVAVLGGVLCPLGGLDSSAGQIFETAAARLRAVSPDAVVEDAGSDRGVERTRRLLGAFAAAACLAQVLALVVIVAR
jgi:hypothetical protein